MLNQNHIESPMRIQISFNKLFEKYALYLKSDDAFFANKAARILELKSKFPFFSEGISDFSLLETYQNEIEIILQDCFNDVLTYNEIKTASVPFQNIIFNASERFKSIIKNAGEGFVLNIKNMPLDDTYIMACTIILRFCYGYDLNLKRPLIYEIPDDKGIMRYYKILYNADFCEITPTEKAIKITEEDYEMLLDNFHDVDLWKAKFPVDSYVFNGFVISNIFDVTDDQSISNIKSTLISKKAIGQDGFSNSLHDAFRSFLGIDNLKIGFSFYDKESNGFEHVYGSNMRSYLLNDLDQLNCEDALCGESYKKLLKEKSYYSVSYVSKLYHRYKENAPPHIQSLYKQGVESAVLAPIANASGLLGVLEIVSEKPKVLNSISANKLVDVMPFIISAVERSINEEENLIEAIIQQECTSIHPSVYWKFRKAAKKFLLDKQVLGSNANFSKLVFKDVYPLFGQIDVKGSSDARNQATQKDLVLQLTLVEKIIESIPEHLNLPIYNQILFQVQAFKKDIKTEFKVDSEQVVNAFFKSEIKPLFHFLAKKDAKLEEAVNDYFSKIDEALDIVYYYRKNYDDTIALINKNMAALLDKKQLEAQQMYPHFFERFKTDGVEHNMYIGESITKEESFNMIYLYNLRLWQLQVMCEMENAYYNNQDKYPVSLDVTSMILVFNQPLSIRFRMDEKQFDVDGTYNARYEVVKKRVDKAFIKGTEERVTEKGKLSIVFSQKEDGQEYMRYIKFLQSKNTLSDDVEIVELEDLQGVTGLKAIKVSILYKNNDANNSKEFYTYNDLMNEIKA